MSTPSHMESERSLRDSAAVDHCPVVFILGIGPRSGTNYLANLIYLHPECDHCAIWEDFAVSGAPLLQDYVDRVTKNWNWPRWGLGADVKRALSDNIYRSVVTFLAGQRQGGRPDGVEKYIPHPKFVVTKTPSVENLAMASRFPHTRVIVIVRDGRSFVSSSMKGFKWGFEQAAKRWATAGQAILRAKAEGQDFLLVRYEDLLTDLPTQMIRIFEYLGLDGASYDFGAASGLPLTGSSFVPGTDGIHWGGVPRGDVSLLVNRYQDWTIEMHRNFNEIAGDPMKELGYELVLTSLRRWSAARRGWQWCRSCLRRLVRRISSGPSLRTRGRR